jgi:Lamin Tail Domain
VAPLVQPQTQQPPANEETEEPTTSAPAVLPANEPGWATVKSFSGQDGTTTPAFHISGSKWRIIWAVDVQDPKLAVFNILVFNSTANMLINSIAYTEGVGIDTVSIGQGRDDFYLKIIAANLNKWSIDVEDFGSETPDEPLQITEIRYQGMKYSETVAGGHSIVEWDEYVQIKNFSDEPQNIAGWQLKNITKGAPTFIFPMFKPCSCTYLGNWKDCVKECYPKQPCTIGPRESLRVYTGEPQWESGGYCFYYFPGNIWDNETPDTAVLYNAAGQEVSRRSYFIIPGESAPNYSTPL